MIPMPYNSVRWVILAIGAIILAVLLLVELPIGAQIGLAFLAVLTGASAVVPPGIYGWLLRGKCPNCQGHVEWAAANPAGEPYNEQVIRRCRTCDTVEVEWSFRT